MTSTFVALIAHETRMQYRYGIYAAYAFVIAFYAAVLFWGRDIIPTWFAAVIIYTDPAAVGFFFLGALLMLEKAEGVRLALSTTPVPARDFSGPRRSR